MDATAKLGQPKVPPKKAYLKPSLQIFGSMEKITQRTGIGANGDSPAGKSANNGHTG